MFVGFDKEVGTLIAIDKVINCSNYLLCDGKTIQHKDYPELFHALGLHGDSFHLPDMRGLLPGVSFYYIAIPLPD